MAIITPRIKYQKLFAKGDRIINIGCGENPCDFGLNTVHVDLDVYNHPNFVQADAHDLPFPDNSFDVAVLGDVLEHSPNPALMLSEAGRVSKRVVATVYEETRISEDMGENISKFHSDVKAMGFSNHLAYLKSLPDFKDKIVSVTDDSKISHHPHIQAFTDETLRETIREAGLKVIIFHKYLEGGLEDAPIYNWLLVLQT